MVYRGANIAACALFVYAATLQLNDPDPVPWLLWYGTGALFCAAAVVRRLPPRPAAAFALLAGVSAILTFAMGRGSVEPMEGFVTTGPFGDEVVREALGLVLLGLWTGGLSVLALRDRATPPPG